MAQMQRAIPISTNEEACSSHPWPQTQPIRPRYARHQARPRHLTARCVNSRTLVLQPPPTPFIYWHPAKSWPSAHAALPQRCTEISAAWNASPPSQDADSGRVFLLAIIKSGRQRDGLIAPTCRPSLDGLSRLSADSGETKRCKRRIQPSSNGPRRRHLCSPRIVASFGNATVTAQCDGNLSRPRCAVIALLIARLGEAD
jgi:hypothetical protein